MQFCITSSLSSANLFDVAITDTYLTKVLAQPQILSQDYLYIINLFFSDFTSVNTQKKSQSMYNYSMTEHHVYDS